MSISKNATLEISQVANGFILRCSPSQWSALGPSERSCITETGGYFVFRTMAELQQFLAEHFTHRARPQFQDAVETVT